jgi:hypothetical protein
MPRPPYEYSGEHLLDICDEDEVGEHANETTLKQRRTFSNLSRSAPTTRVITV